MSSLATDDSCQREEIRLGEFRLSPAWARLPLVAARRVVRKGRIDIG